MDLFRLLSMFLVVMIHISGGMPGRVCACLVSISICAVNCFGVLSGYVGFGSKHRVSDLWWLWGQVIWYYLLINCIAICLLPDKVTVIDLWKSFFPVCKVAYWYFTAYFCLFWGMPALDSIIEHLNYKRLRSAIIIFGGLFCLTSFTPFRNLGYFWGSGDGASVAPPGYCATWLGYLYLVGAYFRQYPPRKNIRARWYLAGFVCCTAVNLIWIRLCVWGYLSCMGMSDIVQYTSPTVLLQAVCLLLFFRRLHIRHARKTIAYLSSMAFSVYLIHTHPIVYAQFFASGNHWLPTSMWYVTAPIALVAGVGIFVGCLLLDVPRYWLFGVIRRFGARHSVCSIPKAP